MERGPYILITNPPHAHVDARAVGEVIGLLAAEAILKANYQVPEIWVIADTGEAAAAASHKLALAGVRMTTIDGADIGAVPGPVYVREFRLGAADIALVTEDGEVKVPLDATAYAVLCKPRSEMGVELNMPGRPSLTSSDGPESGDLVPFIDLYSRTDRVRRYRLNPLVTDFHGLGAAITPSGGGNLLKDRGGT
jgi:hypothetical protein